MKLRLDEGSGAWEAGRGVLQGERGSLGERGRSMLTASAGSSCSSATEMDGSEGTGVAVLDSRTVSARRSGLPSGWVSSENTSFTGEKHRETFPVSFLFWDD